MQVSLAISKACQSNSLPAKAVLLLLRFLKRRWHEVTEEFFTEGEFARRQKKKKLEPDKVLTEVAPTGIEPVFHA